MKLKLLTAFLLLWGLVFNFGALVNIHASPDSGPAIAATVSGTITDADGNGLVGATIIEDGTTNGTTSREGGKYSINVQDNATLLISFIGFEKQTIPVNGRTTIDIQMVEEASSTEEVVIVGYGTQKKRDVTGAIATIDDEKISKIPVASGVQAMQGQAAGVDIQSSGGRPGQAPTIKIRGRRSISASNDPLFVIDGIPQTSGNRCSS